MEKKIPSVLEIPALCISFARINAARLVEEANATWQMGDVAIHNATLKFNMGPDPLGIAKVHNNLIEGATIYKFVGVFLVALPGTNMSGIAKKILLDAISKQTDLVMHNLLSIERKCTRVLALTPFFDEGVYQTELSKGKWNIQSSVRRVQMMLSAIPVYYNEQDDAEMLVDCVEGLKEEELAHSLVRKAPLSIEVAVTWNTAVLIPIYGLND